MAGNGDDLLLKMRQIPERRVRDQLRRHLAIDPNADADRIIDLQIQQELVVENLFASVTVCWRFKECC